MIYLDTGCLVKLSGDLFLPDPDDEMVLELAFAANCDFIVTQNIGDFRGSLQLGIPAITPRNFLKILRNHTSKGSVPHIHIFNGENRRKLVCDW